ncbi:MAG: HNH endonuclease [Acidimicrobiia bacterium]|nr:HNH endonuclease [Acidimicrobiia bacterium]NNC75886.1 DUF222 domain-containing protein [Acidimicrobiia bacterium]
MDVLAEDLRLVSRADLVEEIKSAEREISRLRARQVCALRELSRKAWPNEGAGVNRLARELDVSRSTADALLETSYRTPEESPRMSELASGEATFDRTHALAKLFVAGGRDVEMAEAASRDIAGVNRLATKVRRIRRRDERQTHQQRHVRAWMSLDETAGFLSGQFTGMDWHTVTTALDHRADQIPTDAGTREQRRADGLVALASDWLHGVEPQGQGHVVSVMVDATQASSTDAETGVRITGGPRIGPDTLDAITCEGAVEVMVDRHGTPIAVGPTTRVVPPKLRRHILNRDGGCTIDGCTSRYRLEVHHIIPRSKGGTHDAGNLTTVCWFHHHIAIHRNGCHIDPESSPQQRQIKPPDDW